MQQRGRGGRAQQGALWVRRRPVMMAGDLHEEVAAKTVDLFGEAWLCEGGESGPGSGRGQEEKGHGWVLKIGAAGWGLQACSQAPHGEVTPCCLCLRPDSRLCPSARRDSPAAFSSVFWCICASLLLPCVVLDFLQPALGGHHPWQPGALIYSPPPQQHMVGADLSIATD